MKRDRDPVLVEVGIRAIVADRDRHARATLNALSQLHEQLADVRRQIDRMGNFHDVIITPGNITGAAAKLEAAIEAARTAHNALVVLGEKEGTA